MGTKFVNGKDIDTTYKKKKGRFGILSDKCRKNKKTAVHTDDNLEFISTSFGKTISLGGWEFARVSMGIKAGLCSPASEKDRRFSRNKMNYVIDEFINREESVLRSRDRENLEIDIEGIGVQVVVWMEYGMTLSTGNNESEKFDFVSSRPVSDGNCIEDVILELSQELGDMVKERIGRIKGSDGDVGI